MGYPRDTEHLQAGHTDPGHVGGLCLDTRTTRTTCHMWQINLKLSN